MRKAIEQVAKKYPNPLTLEKHKYKLRQLYYFALNVAVSFKLSDEQFVMLFRENVDGILRHAIDDMQTRQRAPSSLIIEVISEMVKVHPHTMRDLNAFETDKLTIRLILSHLNKLVDSQKTLANSYSELYHTQIKKNWLFEKLEALRNDKIKKVVEQIRDEHDWKKIEATILKHEEELNKLLEGSEPSQELQEEFLDMKDEPITTAQFQSLLSKIKNRKTKATKADLKKARHVVQATHVDGVPLKSLTSYLDFILRVANRFKLDEKQTLSLLKTAVNSGALHIVLEGLEIGEFEVEDVLTILRTEKTDKQDEMTQALKAMESYNPSGKKSKQIFFEIKSLVKKIMKVNQVEQHLAKPAVIDIVESFLFSLFPKSFKDRMMKIKVKLNKVGAVDFYKKMVPKMDKYFQLAYRVNEKLLKSGKQQLETNENSGELTDNTDKSGPLSKNITHSTETVKYDENSSKFSH